MNALTIQIRLIIFILINNFFFCFIRSSYSSNINKILLPNFFTYTTITIFMAINMILSMIYAMIPKISSSLGLIVRKTT